MELVVKYFEDEITFHRDETKPLVHMMEFAKILYLPKTSRDVLSIVWREYRFQLPNGVGKPAWFVNVPGMYQMIFASEHEQAVKIQRWVFEDVLPAIQEKGGYISPDATREQLTNLQSDITTRLSAFESAYSLCKDQGDERGMLFIKDQVQNLADKLNHLDSDIPQDWLSVSEILEQRGYSLTKPIRNSLSQIGKNVKKDYESDTGLAVKVTTKAVGSGHKSDEIKVYPPNWHDRIEQVAVSYWQSRDISYHNKL